MENNHIDNRLKIASIILFFGMVLINGLANILPFNHVTTAQVSDSYPNLFAPVGLTFAIWGVIYLLLLMFVIYYHYAHSGKIKEANIRILNKIAVYFSISCVANMVWIFCWHYRQIALTVLLTATMLVCLAIINVKTSRAHFSNLEKLVVRLPFSVYFGWLCVAMIANITAYLVDIGWTGFGLGQPLWTIIMLSIGTLIGCITIWINKDLAYGLTLIWAFAGIWIKHTALNGFNGRYYEVIVAVALCIVVLALTEAVQLYSRRR